MDASRHTGRTAIVTGAASGIGRATALRMAHEGATVIACDVSKEGLEETLGQLNEIGAGHRVVRADVTDQEDVDEVVAAAGDKIDVLANVAGIMDHFLPLGEVDDGTWERVIGVNLTGVMRLTRARSARHAGGGWRCRGDGGLRGFPGRRGGRSLLYLLEARGDRVGPSRCLLLRAVRHPLERGPARRVETGIGATAEPRSAWVMERAQLKMATMGPVAQSDQVASVISWLASDEASNVNGALVTSDGGWSAA